MPEDEKQQMPRLGEPVPPGYGGSASEQLASPEELAKVRALAIELGGLHRLWEIVNSMLVG
jgi:hypothetical protein